MLSDLTAESFAENLGSTFKIDVEVQDTRGTLALELVEVNLYEKHPGPRPQPFALTFRSAARGALPQAIYKLHHERMGDLEIFLVPIGPDAVGICYEAVFN